MSNLYEDVDNISENIPGKKESDFIHKTLHFVSSSVIFIPLIILGIIILALLIRKHLKWYRTGGSWFNHPLLYPFLIIISFLMYLFRIIKNTVISSMPILSRILKKYWFHIIVVILALTIAIGTPILLLNNSTALGSWSLVFSVITYLLIAATSIYAFKTLIQKQYSAEEMRDEKWIPKSYKIAGETGRTLFYAICLMIFLFVLMLMGYFLFSSEIVQMSSIFFITVIASLIIATGLYVLGKNMLKQKLKKNPIFNILYHAVFILPCIFIETASYLYRELKNTPHFVYRILGVEIGIIFIWYIMPIITDYLYTWMPSRNNQRQTIQDKIVGYDNDIIKINQKKDSIKQIPDSVSSKNKLPDTFWDDSLVNKSLYEKDNSKELKSELINYGFNDEEELNVLMEYIQTNGKKYQILVLREKELQNSKKILEDSLDDLDILDKGTVLLDKAKYLNAEEKIDFTNLMGNVSSPLNYSYAISCWFFLHSNNQKWKNKASSWKNILNFDGRPQIIYNIQGNTLEVRMKSGASKKIIFEKQDFPLQKWHNVVVNYNGGVVDVFLNAKLIASESGILPIMRRANVILGEDNGVSGGITNVIYFSNYMSRTRIESNYRLLRDNPERNPPI
tara:strand:- start:1246 stop:3108 length:1863 start_codon:yes stop_codon:yes gene_type:complete